MARTFGADHFQRGTVLRNYGLVLEATGDLDGADGAVPAIARDLVEAARGED